MAHTYIEQAHTRACVYMSRTLAEPEVLLGSDFSFLFTSCDAFSWGFCAATYVEIVFFFVLIVVAAFGDIFIHLCVFGCEWVRVCLHIRLAHTSYIMATK